MSGTNFNPMLLNPNDIHGNSVPSLPQGPGFTKAFPVSLLAEAKYYVCSLVNHHMHRTDGKRLAFLFGVFEAKDTYDVAYMENEIASGNPLLRKASDNEVSTYKMRIDPKKAMTDQLTPEIENRVRQELDIKLKEEMFKKLSSVGIDLTEEQKAAFHNPDTASVPASEDGNNLASVDAINRLKNAFTGAIKTDGAAIFPTAGSGIAALQGIVGTDRLPNVATSDGSSK